MHHPDDHLTCQPMGLCSWHFRLQGNHLHATTRLHAMTESGQIAVGDHGFDVQKDGVLSGRWLLLAGAEPLYAAQKRTPFHRTLQITGPFAAELRAISPFARAMELVDGEHRATVAPVHPFTRRAVVDGSWPDDRLVVFAFWLTTLLWRRSARDS
jgi:hypothetical protein